MTVGGIGDSNANPPDPNASSGVSTRYDDELYSLVPLVANGSQTISVRTENPSRNDNIFFAGFFLSVGGAVATEDPVAKAGPDQELEGPLAMVQLDGSNSFDGDGQIVSYEWFWLGPIPFATGPTPAGPIPEGEHTITLRVTDNDGLTDEDQVVITVVVTNQPPVPAISFPCDGPFMASFEDVNDDGFEDLVLHFDRASLITNDLTPDTERLFLTAELSDGRFVMGDDVVRPLS